MWNEPSKQELSQIPPLYCTEDTPVKDKLVLMHFFMGGSDWYVVEYDPNDKLFFGYTILNGDTDMAEWGYISFEELKSLKMGFVEVDRDLHWKPCKASEVVAK